MNTRTSYAVMAILVSLVGLAVLPAYAQQLPCPDCGTEDPRIAAQAAIMSQTPITVWVDRDVYGHEDTIMVEGQVANFRPGTDVSLTVIGPPPFRNLIAIAQVSPGSDGSFRTTLNTAGSPWKYDGTYIIKVTYGQENVNNRISVQLTGGIVGLPTVSCDAGEVAASGQCIPYSISGGTVISAIINVGTTSLIVNLQTTDSGEIVLDLPRNVIDAKRGTSDDQFFVLVDGEETSFDETKTSSSRSLTIQFPAGAEEIEIIGTFAIPEFGTIAALILAVAIISIIAISAKTRLNVLPKY